MSTLLTATPAAADHKMPSSESTRSETMSAQGTVANSTSNNPLHQLIYTSADEESTAAKQDLNKMNRRLSIAPLPGRLRMYCPPKNFGAVEKGSIYRSGYPTSDNFDFISSLDIKTIMFVSFLSLLHHVLELTFSSTLVPEPLPEDYTTFMQETKIRHHHIHIPANKDGIINITPEIMATALGVVLNRDNHPLLIHCNRGKVC
jgi:hypothetical protein